MVVELKEGVYWVGAVDWNIKKFHGHEYSTHRGTTYNCYLIVDEKVALVDTVWGPYSRQMIENIEKIIDVKKIDYVIANHAEVDHSGGLPELMKLIPDATVVVSEKGKESIFKHFHHNWNFKVVKTGDSISLGKNNLVFVSAPMLHWPDSMFTYLTGKNILMPNDAFGMHYASSGRFNDEVDMIEVYQEAIKFYDTMWNATEKMAQAIAGGLEKEGVKFKLFNMAVCDRNDVLTEIFKAKGIIIGSPTLNNGLLPTIKPILEDLKGLKFKNKAGAAFGSYGWSGENVKLIEENLEKARIKVVQEGIKFKWQPTKDELEKCVEFGRAFAAKMKGM